MDNYNVKAGQEGENLVEDILNDIIRAWRLSCNIYSNFIFPYASVFGKNGYMYAEVDKLVLTPFFIFIIEVKNEYYSNSNYEDKFWLLNNGDEVSNPLNQNHTHKLTFCSEMKIPREKVITVEVLLKNGVSNTQSSPYKNDYVFSKEDFEQKIGFLLASPDKEQLDKTIFTSISDISKKSKYKTNIHIEKLKKAEKEQTRIRRVIGHCALQRTDIIVCDKCKTGRLCFREYLGKLSDNQTNNSTQYLLGCSNYGNSINCDRKVYIDKKRNSIDYMNLTPVTIEQRNGWGDEKKTITLLDHVRELQTAIDREKAANEQFRDQLQYYKTKATRAEKCKDLESKLMEAYNQIDSLQNKLDGEIENNKKYKKLFGNLFYRKKK